MENNKGIGAIAHLEKCNFFTHGVQYAVKFEYRNNEQMKRMQEAFDKGLIPACGSNSMRANMGRPYIMPYLMEKDGTTTARFTGIVGGTSIPEDLLDEFVRRFVELDGMTVICGGKAMHGKYDKARMAEFKRDMDTRPVLDTLRMGENQYGKDGM